MEPRQRPGHQLAPVEGVAADQLAHDADRHGAHARLAEEEQRVEELVLRQREGEDAGGQEAGQAEGKDDPRHGAPAAGAVDHGLLLQLLRHRLEVAHQQPGDEGHEQRRIGQHHGAERIAQLHPADEIGHRHEQQRLGNQVGHGHGDGQQRARRETACAPAGRPACSRAGARCRSRPRPPASCWRPRSGSWSPGADRCSGPATGAGWPAALALGSYSSALVLSDVAAIQVNGNSATTRNAASGSQRPKSRLRQVSSPTIDQSLRT